MPGRRDVSKQRRYFSLTVSIVLILSSLLVGITVQTPNAAAIQTHNVGNVDIEMLTAWGRILKYISWKGTTQTVNDPSLGGMGFIGLVIDHDGYDHTPGYENISDSFDSHPYTSQDDLEEVTAQDWLMTGDTQKSFGTFQNKGILTGDPDDILINQTAWTVLDKDWAIIQWALYNLKPVDITDLKIGLEVPLSFVGKNGGVGGDSGDDIDGFDAANNTYWAQDDGGTTIGFASAITTEPITHYYSEDGSAFASFDEFKKAYEDETWLFQRITASNQAVGSTPGNRISTVGWDGITIGVGSVKTFTLVIAVNDSHDNMITAVQDAQSYYDYVASGFRITEFNDMDSGSGNQYIEVYNNGKAATDLYTAGYRLSVDGGATFLTGDNWDKKPLSTYEYGVFNLDPAENIPAEGGTISLYFDEGGGSYILLDEVSYGQQGLAPDPLGYESVGRRYDTSMVEYSDDWLRNASTGPTWGSQNNVGNIVSPNVLVNRVEFDPFDPAEAYVELMWTGGGGDISGFKIVCDDAYVVPSVTILGAANRYFVLNQSMFPQFFLNMSSSADNIYLYDDNDNLLDMVGWSTAHDQGTFMSRVPDGNGTYQGFDDTTSLTAGWVFNQQPTLQITEFYIDSGNADIEIYNPRGGDIVPDNSRWLLEVDGAPITGTWAPPSIPGNRGYSIFTRGGGGIPGDEGDTITLSYDPGSGWAVMDQIGYGTNGPAPDPLVSESTGRYWDSGTYAYTNDWNRNASTGPTWGAVNDVPAIIPSAIVMNEVMFDPSADPDGHFFVIFNTGLTVVDVTDWSIVCDEIYQFNWTWATLQLGPGSLLITRYTDRPESANMFDSMDATGDNVYMYDDLGQRIDMVGWDTAHLTGMSAKRVPDGNGTNDGYDDVTSEVAGWVFNSPIDVIVTEISDGESTQAQIEVFNPWYPPIDMSVGFTFNSSSVGGQLSGNWYISTADTGDYAIFNVTTPGGLDFEGDSITFYQNGFLNEELSYGNEGTIPDPLPGESVERVFYLGSYTDHWCRNVSTGPNFGLASDVPYPNTTKRILLNEIMFNPSVPGNGFVEIYTNSSLPMNISGYRIVGDTEYIIPDGTVLTSDDPFFYLVQSTDPAFFASLSSSRDNVYLYNSNGSFIDMVGWSSSHVIDTTISRVPAGNGTRDGYDDISSIAAGWQFGQAPTILLIYVYPDGIKYGDRGTNVSHNLTIMNKHTIDDIVEISNSSSPGGWEVIILDEFGNPLPDTTGDGNPDIFVPAGSQVNITVVIMVPPDILMGFVETTTISVQSTVNTLYGDSTILTTRVAPFILYNKSASPQIINIEGTGYDEETSITLSVSGMGYPVEGVASNNADIVFVVDDTGSMAGVINDIIQKIQDITLVFQKEITSVRFGLVTYKDAPERDQVLTYKTHFFISAVLSLFAIGGGDRQEDVYGALEMAINSSWRSGNISKIIILIGDAEDHNPYSPCPLVAAAVKDEWGIFTSAIACSMQPPFMPDTFIAIAENGSGVYAYYNGMDSEALAQAIVDAVLTFVPLIYISAKDDDISDSDPMIQDVLPDYINYVSGSASIAPDVITIDGNDNTTLEWNVTDIVIGEVWTVTFNVTSSMIGPQLSNVVSKSRINYTAWDNSSTTVYFPECWLDVLPPPLLQPTLYINISPDQEDIVLYWDPPSLPGVDYYLIYRATQQTEFDFSTPWINTSSDNEPGEPGPIPQRTMWNDTNAALVGDPNYAEEYYYVLRAVNILGEVSRTSRTVGKWTRIFPQGVSTFSLPLEPLGTMNTTADYYLTDMGADYIKWMDPFFHIWNKHGDGGVNDTQIEVGKGYEVKFGSPTKYTFMGMPGAMIRYTEGSYLGFDYNSEARDLDASVNPATGDVTLTWSASSNPGTVQYHVYYATTRDGFHGTRGVDYTLLAALPVGTLTTTHFGVALQDTQYYYIVIPLNATDAEGATTYSIGVWASGYPAQYDTLGIPLILDSYQTADWYCDMGNVVGINYFIESSQRWSWHSTRMPAGAFDPVLVMSEGYQISTSNAAKFTFIGI